MSRGRLDGSAAAVESYSRYPALPVATASTSTSARRVRREPDERTAAWTRAVTSKVAFAPTVFGASPIVASAPRSPPGVRHGLAAVATSHVASVAMKGVVTGYTPILRTGATSAQ